MNIAVVLAVIAVSAAAGSMLKVRGSMSTNTGTAPRDTIAVAVDENVKVGQMTSSPGLSPIRTAASSRACVHEVVRTTPRAPVTFWSNPTARLVNGPSPCQWSDASASATYVDSDPVT